MLTERREAILKALVGEYIYSAAPVASETIVRKHGLSISAATVRNEMANLEDEGYITRPHTSAGAVPVDKGYRFYVKSIPTPTYLPPEIQEAATKEMNKARKDLESWISAATVLLAKMVQNLGVTSYPKAPETRLRHVELVYLQEVLAMLILVLQGARVDKQLLPLREPVSPEEMAQAGNKLNTCLAGLSHREIEAKRLELSPFEEEVLEAALRIMEEEDQNLYQGHFVDGLRHLFSQPEFAGSEKAQEVVNMLEERRFIQAILNQTAPGSVVQVIIGEENQVDVLHGFSVVLCQYGIPGETAGLVAVLGPTRMEYRRTISSVQFVSSLMTGFIEDIQRKPLY
ncbi:MAG: heat-inducible transcription repressor HrcA [Chloroflexi bacterium]|nr:heat-inducible transcription repressor HrcA [Chloroflexota bacterium]